MSKVTFRYGPQLPLEMHKVRVVQKLTLLPVEQRLQAMTAAGNNTFLLQNADVYLDMLTDSGVNAMSDNQVAAMMIADDSYAGSATFTPPSPWTGSSKTAAVSGRIPASHEPCGSAPSPRSSASRTSCPCIRAGPPRTSWLRCTCPPATWCR